MGGVLLLLADWLGKWWARGEGKYLSNQGVAFGWQGGGEAVIFWVVMVAIVGFLWWREKKEQWWWLLVGGGGNLGDRVFWGAVTDWIRMPFLGLWFNLADVYISLGVLLAIKKEVANLLVLKHGDKKTI